MMMMMTHILPISKSALPLQGGRENSFMYSSIEQQRVMVYLLQVLIGMLFIDLCVLGLFWSSAPVEIWHQPNFWLDSGFSQIWVKVLFT